MKQTLPACIRVRLTVDEVFKKLTNAMEPNSQSPFQSLKSIPIFSRKDMNFVFEADLRNPANAFSKTPPTKLVCSVVDEGTVRRISYQLQVQPRPGEIGLIYSLPILWIALTFGLLLPSGKLSQTESLLFAAGGLVFTYLLKKVTWWCALDSQRRSDWIRALIDLFTQDTLDTR